MELMNRARRCSAWLAGAAVAGISGVASAAAGPSGIDPTAVTAVITDGQAQGIVIGLAMLGLVVAFKIVRKVRGAA